MGHLSKLQDEYGEKGLTVLAITGEDRAMNLRYMVHSDNNFTYKVGIGGGGAYEVRGIPHAYLIDPNGVVVFEGSPSSIGKKDLKALLKQVRKPTDEEIESRSGKMLKLAENLAGDSLFLRAEGQAKKLLAKFPGSEAAETVKDLVEEWTSGDAQAEYDAQKSIAKLVGGPEAPDPHAKKLKTKKLASAAKKLAKYAGQWAESAPRSAKLATDWADILGTKWK